ncbi:hypothetical protein [Haloplanus pelagicus]|jgi:DNA-directed RNA polymerase subunit RPC12/RpoP|uniref:hypothetical protein n=1 Tax=Haloplanus pelagicus TaxID=2949995 RepID=UPI00203C534A|nr:hypothetical protein [Haloplanus sp. HW8-1]
MLGRVFGWLGLGDADADANDDADLDWSAPSTEYGGDGPRRRYTCMECGATVEGDGPDRQIECPDCGTVYKRTLVPDHAICPACEARIDDAAFYPETRRDTEFADCGACGYRWESDPR